MSIKLFILEDRVALNAQMVEYFSKRNFQVVTAHSAEEASEVLAQVDSLDVCVLDNFLGEDQPSGSELARIIREETFKNNPPECLVYSGEDAPIYYQQAIRAGAADYLRKSEVEVEDLAIPLRALALCRALRWERQPALLRALRKIAMEATHRDGALITVVQQLLLPQLQRVLATPFHLIMSTLDRTFCLSDQNNGKESVDVERVLGMARPKTITELPTDLLPMEPSWGPASACHLVPLYERGHFKLALSLTTVARSKANRYPDDGLKTAEALLQYLQPVFFRALENLVELMAGADMAHLESMSDSCSSFSGRLSNLRDLLAESGTYQDGLARLNRLINALDYRADEGENLLQGYHHGPEAAQGDLAAMAREVWLEAGGREEHFRWRGDDYSFRDPNLLWHCFHRFFGWMAERAEAQGTTPRVKVTTRRVHHAWTITLEDEGRRGSTWEREALFEPFSAHPEWAFFELREAVKQAGGYVEDRSDEDQVSCHRFVVTLPPEPVGV